MIIEKNDNINDDKVMEDALEAGVSDVNLRMNFMS